MSTSPNQTVSVDATGQLAQNDPGFDPTPAIAAGEQGLLDFLNTPVQQRLGELPLQQFPEQPPADQQPPADPGAGGMPFDPSQLIGPVVNALGTLGSGQFSGTDPTQVLRGVSEAFDGTALPLQQARSS